MFVSVVRGMVNARAVAYQGANFMGVLQLKFSLEI